MHGLSNLNFTVAALATALQGARPATVTPDGAWLPGRSHHMSGSGGAVICPH